MTNEIDRKMDEPMTFTCILCRRQLPVSRRSSDHIIPDSLGCPLTINDVCKECNDSVGSQLESELRYHFSIAFKLSELSIKSRSGRDPSFIQTDARTKAYMDDAQSGVRLKSHVCLGSGGARQKIIPTQTASGHLIVEGTDFEATKTALEKKGVVVISRKQFEEESAPPPRGTKMAVFESRAIPKSNICVETGYDFVKVQRAIAKMGLAYLSYTYGPEKALLPCFDDVRSYIRTGHPVSEVILDYPMPAGAWPSKEGWHGVALFTVDRGNTLFMVDFFGCSRNLAMLGPWCEWIPYLRHTEIAYVNPVNRKVLQVASGKAHSVTSCSSDSA
ncbi:HNH endonuclease [candidate division TA06 bacterium]|uniref:HNH endonuclease n=1 Tax=candidate division TA06 bacterium TaxID=2250710 RepID=A0A523US32_UNCT6|nr:MAG: HNH endonuclease [candidate division TA06 bacterium]